jgi:signal transduction histidine kinase
MHNRASNPPAQPDDVPFESGAFESVLEDRTGHRAASLQQLLLMVVVMIVAILLLASGFDGDLFLFFVGALMIFALAAITVAVPWRRVPHAWLALVPLLDIVAIGIIRAATPGTGAGLMWVFPIIWLASGFGVAGSLCGLVLATGGYVVSNVADPRNVMTFSVFLLPIVLAVVAASALLTSRRARAQRHLLKRQATLLSRALERARGHEQSLAEVLDAVQFGVLRMDRDGRTVFANDAHTRLLGAAAGQLLDADGVTPLPADAAPLARARRGEAFQDVRVWLRTPTGERRAVDISARRLRDADGSDAGAVLVSQDVGDDATLGGDAGSPERTSPSRCDAGAVVREAVGARAGTGLPRGLSLDTSRVAATPAQADARRLRQVIDTVLDNALRASRDGGRIALATASRDSTAMIFVQDTGLGLTDEELTTVFDPSSGDSGGGHTDAPTDAAGLARSRDIMRRMGGDITVSSALGGGSTFVLSLPAAEKVPE